MLKMLTKILILFNVCVVSSVCQQSCSETIPYIKSQYNIRGEVTTFWSVKTIKACCEGYMRVRLGHGVENFLCDPICQPRCSPQQFCEKPGVCTCFPGYIAKLNLTGNKEICQPICSDCEQSYCIAPNICRYPTTAKDQSFTRQLRPAGSGRPWNTDMYPNSTASETNSKEDTNANILLIKMRNQTATTKASSEVRTPINKSISYTDKPSLNYTLSTTNEEDIDYYELLIKTLNQNFTKAKDSTARRAPLNTSVGGVGKSLNHTGYSGANLTTEPDVSEKIFRSVTVQQTTTSTTSNSHLIDNKTHIEHNGNIKQGPLETKKSGIKNASDSKKEMENRSWAGENATSILLPVIGVLTAALVVILLILWQRTTIMVCLRARYYVADDHLPNNIDPQKVSYSKSNEVKMLKKIDLEID